MRERLLIVSLALTVLLSFGCGRGPVGGQSSQGAQVTFSATPTVIHAGDAVTLTWNARGASSVIIDLVGTVAASGTATVHPQQTSTITLTAKYGAGDSVISTARVEVVGGTGPTVAGVLSWKRDESRLGLYDGETTLTPASVNPAKFGKLGEQVLDGLVMAQPLYIRGLDMGAAGLHNVIIAATEHASVYAFDADNPKAAALWKRNFLPAGYTTMPDNFGGRSTFDGEVGITGTPVIDPGSGHLYFVSAQVSPGGAAEQVLHAIDIRNGNDVLSTPIQAAKIVASVPGDGEASVNGVINFDPQIQNQRPGLLLRDGVIYIAWGSFSDRGAFHGWVMAYDANTLQQMAVWNSATKFAAKDIGGDHGGGASFWAGGAGISADIDGNIYVVSGDGTFGADVGDPNYGDSVLKLKLVNNQFQVVDWFTPANQECFNAADLEIGSGGIAVLPDSVAPGRHLLISLSKEGRIYLLDRDSLGHYAANDAQIPQKVMVGAHECVLGVTTGAAANDVTWNRLYGNPAFWNGNLYMGPSNFQLTHYRFDGAGKLSATPVSKSATNCGNRGCNVVVSSNGNSGAIVWSYEKNSNGNGVLHAYDANDLSNELWNSTMNAGRDQMFTGIGFATPVVADGRVVAAYHNSIVIYGPLP